MTLYPAFTWGPWGTYQIYERTLTQLKVMNRIELRGVAAYNDAATAALPTGTQVGDLVVVSTGGGNWNGGKQKPYNTTGHGPSVDARLTGYILHNGGEHYWGTVTDLSALPLPSFDQGSYGDTGFTRAGGVVNGTAWTVVATFFNPNGRTLSATLHLHETRGEEIGNLTQIDTTPVNASVVSLLMDATGWSSAQFNPPGMTQAMEQYVHGIHYYSTAVARTAPPGRIFPRSDGLGVGGGRHFPPPVSQQRSGRRFGHY